MEQKKGFSIQEEPNVTTSGSLRKSIQITESKKDCSEEENKFTSMPESTFLLSEKCSLLKRKCCSEEMRNAEVPCKLMKKGMFNYRTGSVACHPWNKDSDKEGPNYTLPFVFSLLSNKGMHVVEVLLCVERKSLNRGKEGWVVLFSAEF